MKECHYLKSIEVHRAAGFESIEQLKINFLPLSRGFSLDECGVHRVPGYVTHQLGISAETGFRNKAK